MIKKIKTLQFFLFFVAVAASLFLAVGAKAASAGDMVTFNVDPNYDTAQKSQVNATLVKVTSNLYFYIDAAWWNSKNPTQQNDISSRFDSLSQEFGSNMYPTLTAVYGSESNPGIDKDPKITLLFESINNNVGGYFRTDDEYSKLQAPSSNEREMVYLPLDQINSSQLKVFLAHEFVHLIVFNQKNKLQGVSEETWLSEAYSDYASTLLGYDAVYDGSNLQRRVEDFLTDPNDSLTEWQNTKYDYAAENLFIHYIVDHYGVSVLTNALKSNTTGITSLNQALVKTDAKENFQQIFTDWTVTMIINNCATDIRYCYFDKNLANLTINPSLIFLPLSGESSLTMNNTTKNWVGNWQKIIGGTGDLTLQFSSDRTLSFQVPYIIYDKNNNYTVHFLSINNKGSGEINIKDFGTKYNSLVVIPSLQSKFFGFTSSEPIYSYNFFISITGQQDAALVQKLQAQIASLKQQLADILANSTSGGGVCQLNISLYPGISNIKDVTCLQQFLKSQGADIYPQGLVTGNFGPLTKAAVIRFQEKYSAETLKPAGLTKGTGLVGALTRLKINQLLD